VLLRFEVAAGGGGSISKFCEELVRNSIQKLQWSALWLGWGRCGLVAVVRTFYLLWLMRATPSSMAAPQVPFSVIDRMPGIHSLL
jgi:hypothetical protein